MDKQNDRYIFSVIVPIYNVELYLEEAIKSIVEQTIGFRNIQLILVNDGSPDDSYKICEKYREKYPENVLYIEKENGGVSSARNEGLKHATGTYVIFFDGDDMWEKTAFQKIAKFFEDNENAFDVCSCRIEYAGDYASKVHPLDYKFEKGTRIADLHDEPEMVSSTIGNAVFRRSALGSMEFTLGLSAGEDSEFVNTVLLNNPVLGIKPDAVFYYRRNIGTGSGSSSATSRKSWYLDVPREYYGSLCKKSIEKYGTILPFIQHVVLYDMRWRFNKPQIVNILSEVERTQYIDMLHQILNDFDLGVIRSMKGLDQFQKLYIADLKYGKPIIAEAERIKHKYCYDGRMVINLRRESLFNIAVLEVEDGDLRVEGITYASVIRRPYTLYASDGKNEYVLQTERCKNADINGFAGETAVEAEAFKVFIPARKGTTISFFIRIEGNSIKLNPGYRSYIGQLPVIKGHSYEYSYCTRKGYLIRFNKNNIRIFKESAKALIASEARLTKEILKYSGPAAAKDRIAEAALQRNIKNSKIKNRAAFITVRSDGELNENLKRVYEQLDAPKVMLAKKNLYLDKLKGKAARMVYSSKVVVTDDYCFLFKDYGKKDGQIFIQLWHATGAGKHFGKDGGITFAPIDRLYHRDYDLVAVSGEASRVAFASAFDIPVDKLQAVGVSRTDVFFDDEKISQAHKNVLSKHPELEGKEVILYMPTFRDVLGLGRKYFRPALDFRKLSKELLPNQIFVIKPHPVMTEPILNETFSNILELRDVGTNDIMIASDLMVTDYSSAFFEYALLKKPVVFFCYDYDEYDRDFYIDFEHELPGDILKTQEELFEYLRRGEHPILENYEAFYKRFMGGCDGHSTERIVRIIKKMIEE